MNIIDTLWLSWLAFPVGLLVILVWRKRRWTFVLGGLFCLTSVVSAVLFREVFVWQFDLIRNWRATITAKVGEYDITLVQEPGIDFYDTTLRIVRPDGGQATIIIDGDDHKWKNPRSLREGSTLLFIADNESRDSAPAINVQDETVTVSGWTKGTFRLAELEYKELQNKRLEATGDPLRGSPAPQP